MVSKRDKDTEEGTKVLFILLLIGSIGFLWFSSTDTFADLGLGSSSLICCNTVLFIATLIFLSTWIYTRRENRVKDFLDQKVEEGGYVQASWIVESYGIKTSTAVKHLMAWAENVPGTYDQHTGLFTREPVEDTASPEDANNFCPTCGSSLTQEEGMKKPFCDNCKKYV